MTSAIIKHRCVEQAYAKSPWSKIKNQKDDRSKEPTEIQVNIVETSDELDRLNKIVAYEKEHNVKIL